MYFKNLLVDKNNKRVTGLVEVKPTDFEKLDAMLQGKKAKDCESLYCDLQ